MSSAESTPPPAGRPAPEYSAPPPPPRRNRWTRILLVLLVLSVLVNLSLLGQSAQSTRSRVQEKFHSLAKGAVHKVALLRIEGPILSGEGFVKDQIDRIRDDEDVKAVVLHINSPGGGVAASDYLYHHLKKLCRERELPMVVHMGALCASGGYYTAMAVAGAPNVEEPNAIFAEPSTTTGSIGVIIPHYNLAGLLEQWKIEEDSIASGELKSMGSITRPMTDKEREIFQQLVDEAFNRFKEIIREGRPRFREHPEELDTLATGQIFTASQAKNHGLIDEIGYLEEAIDRAVELTGLDRGQVKVVEYEQKKGLVDLLLQSQSSKSFDLAQWLDLATPRAYYLFTGLPPLEPGLMRP